MQDKNQLPQTSDEWHKRAQFLVPRNQPSIFDLVEMCAKSMNEQKEKEVSGENAN